MNHKLILTADDYGLCDVVNEAIEECLATGAVRTTCVMVSMPNADTAASLRQRFPHASIGIHWTVTQGPPLLSKSDIRSLVSSEGNFHSAPEFRRRWLLGRVNLAELYAELGAQYQRFCELVGPPDFWNSHQNAHLLPRLFRAFVSFGQKLGIPAMRCHRRLLVPRASTQAHYNLKHPLYWLKAGVIARWSRQAEARGVIMPQGRIYMPGHYVGSVPIEELVRHVQWSAVTKAVEMVVHPATTINETLFGELTDSRVLEYKMLRDRGLADRLRQQGFETVGFEALSKPVGSRSI